MSNYHQSWLRLLKKQRAIAVIRSSQPSLAYKMAQAVSAGGMSLIEITWNSEAAPDLINQLRSHLPDCTIGTGTLMNKEQLKAAVDAGAQFLFSPHLDTELIKSAVAAGVPVVPGALSPTEIVTAWQAGASCVKVFPIQAVGGASYIKALQGPLGQIPLIPTGGVTLSNAPEFIKAGAIAIGLAGDLFPKQLIDNQDWQGITEQAKTLKRSIAKMEI